MKLDSLKNRAEFDFVYKNAKRFFHKHFILYVFDISQYQPIHTKEKKIINSIQSREAQLHLGLSISKKIGKANKRNLLKRRLRAIVYENCWNCDGFIFVIVAKASVTSLEFATLKKDVLFAIAKILDLNVLRH